jgi:hypothetical protein
MEIECTDCQEIVIKGEIYILVCTQCEQFQNRSHLVGAEIIPMLSRFGLKWRPAGAPIDWDSEMKTFLREEKDGR